MTSGSYAILVGHTKPERADALSLANGSPIGMVQVFSQSGIAAYAAARTPIDLGRNGRWVAIGDMFGRDDEPSPFRPREGLSGIDDILDRAWGGYVAVEVDERGDRVLILRDPSGAKPCWMVSGAGATVFTDDVRLGLRLVGDVTPSIDHDVVAQLLLYPDLRGPRTPLTGIQEVQPGTARCWSRADDRWHTDLLWSPWQFTDPADRIDDPKQAAKLLGRHVDAAVGCWCSTLERPLVELSGGLDSSIVAAALAAADRPVIATTLVTPGPDGDERRYAAAVADALGGSLTETTADAEMINLFRSASANLPRPASRSFAQAGDRLAVGTARSFGADGFVSGGGGDNVFAFYNSALPAADRLRTAGPGFRALGAIADAAQLTRRSVWRTGRRAITRAWIDPRLPRWPRDPSLLHPDLVGLPMPNHPWLEPPDGALPGKHWHVRLLITIQNHLEGFAREGLPILFPLLAQPLVECALRIPSWQWIEGGRDRAMARRAFAGRLPGIILERRTKGGLDSLADAIFKRHHAVLTELLLDGWLASSGILDRDAVERALREGGPASRLRLLALADVEAWGRYWRC